MITVTEATQIIQSHLLALPIMEVALTEAVGQVLREPIYADRDFPPFNRVTMDGIAIQYRSFQSGEDTFEIQEVQYAGDVPKTLLSSDNCLEVMTGAILPVGTDTVIRYEDLKITERQGKRFAHIVAAPKGILQNVHQQGSDRQAEDLLISEGILLSPAEIAVIATIGKDKIRVSQPPRVAIISTGDELVEITEIPLAHQIRQSNSYMLQAALTQMGLKAQRFHLRDDKKYLITEVNKILQSYDMLLLSGGVSKGKADFIPEILQELAVQKLFHEVAQRPGKPFWFGQLPNGPVVFALPGNPVSTFVCFYKYVQPWLNAILGIKILHMPNVLLAEEISFKPDLTLFQPVAINQNNNGEYEAIPLTTGGSGDFAALVGADGFLELPQKRNFFPKGERFPFIGFRS